MTTESVASEGPGEHSSTLRSIVNHLGGLLKHGGATLTSGDVASLRRMDPRRPGTAFFKIAGSVLASDLPGDESARELIETRWAAIMVGLAVLGDLHRANVPLGHALVDANLSELRFDRLLRADADRLVDELPTLARFLAAKGVQADWADAARLILSAGRQDDESARRRLARDYFGALARNTNH